LQEGLQEGFPVEVALCGFANLISPVQIFGRP